MSTTEHWVAAVRTVLESRRARTEALLAPLSDADVHDQHVDFLSPVVWDVGHVGNFEEQWLLRRLGGRAPTDERLDHLYDAFENPRATRGGLELLPREPALRYLRDVRDEVLGGLDRLTPGDDPLLADGRVHRMIAQHESQHQETILQALDLRGDLTPFPPAVPAASRHTRGVDDTDRVEVPAGRIVLGTDDTRWTYDNERPAHEVAVDGFVIDRFPVTVRRYAAFVAAGGYDQPEHWSDRGWRWRTETGHAWPQGWEPDGDGGWGVRRLGYRLALDPREPVQHVSWFEAEAFARWAGGRLPTEVEWEKAAGWDPTRGRKQRYPWGDTPPTPARANVGLQSFGPAPVGTFPDGRSPYGLEQCAGDVSEWTSAPFEPWPGVTAFPYREYSAVFFGGQDYRVLRGSSWAISGSMARVTYRNWDHPYRRQVFAGLRLCWDA
jgi:iron(II)-dependent oxidoreductase